MVPLILKAPAQMVDVKMGDFGSRNVSKSGGELGSAARTAFKQLKSTMESVFLEYDVLFKWLQGAVEHSSKR